MIYFVQKRKIEKQKYFKFAGKYLWDFAATRPTQITAFKEIYWKRLDYY